MILEPHLCTYDIYYMAPTQTQTQTYFIVMFMSFFSYACELNFNVILPVH